MPISFSPSFPHPFPFSLISLSLSHSHTPFLPPPSFLYLRFSQVSVVELLRTIAELVIWGDQHDPRFFDFFLERNVLGTFGALLIRVSHMKREKVEKRGRDRKVDTSMMQKERKEVCDFCWVEYGSDGII